MHASDSESLPSVADTHTPAMIGTIFFLNNNYEKTERKTKNIMAFITYQHNLGDVPVMHLPTAAIGLKVGTALYLSAGKLQVAKDNTKPEYISLYDGGGTTVPEGTIVPVEPVYPSTVYETQITGSLSTINIGSVHNINSVGSSITALSDTGVAKVVGYEGKTAGSRVKVVFVEPKTAGTETASE